MTSSRLSLATALFFSITIANAGAQSLPSAPGPQNNLPQAPGVSASAPQAKPEARVISPALRPYGACKAPAGTHLVDAAALPQAPMTRTADTMKGSRPIKLMDGVGATYAFEQGNFVNAKFELLPATGYAAEKADLNGEWERILYGGDDVDRNYALKPTLNGFAVQGFDRKSISGKVMGIYLLFDDTHHVATTLYFLTQDDQHRAFKTLDEYRQRRDRFLDELTACVRWQMDAKPVARPGATAPKPHPSGH